ncbi:signal peptidase II [Lentzea albidocapillata subsp. violacea]|uniref:Lipoprotein signal peptidase n=1 Tax=Lentzea albidocapillata subsp. violacea TaxID=128104 RepID=A0A1G9WU90_9PSEU|nr:signal peptidase II [Lentzea albidocapillata]SDM88184.1 signal peptidase II [Lentzea albidocapillata subsp. violacea]
MIAPAHTTTVTRARLVLVAIALGLAALDLGLKAWAERGLTDGRYVDLGVIQLRLAFNPGVAFSLGDTLPAWLVLTLTGLIITGLAVYTWRTARTGTRPTRLALGVVLAGAVANFVDRARDGVVTDYLHTGWFPTFNGADVYITLGAITLILATLHAERRATHRTERGAP